MPGTTLSSGARKTITLAKAPIKAKEISFNWGAGSGTIQLRNHVVSADVNPPEWEYDNARRLLKRKSPMLKGEDVKKVQQKLMALGFNVGAYKDDSKYGKDTEGAVKEFQKRHGLELDGKVGQETRTFLGLQGGVAYTKNTQFIIKVKFTAPKWINSAEIRAQDAHDGFGGLGSEPNPSKPVKVNFSGGVSSFCKFKIKTKPTKISLNKTRWLWRCRNINGKISQTKAIGRSDHIIYIICNTPQDPMAKPWIAVLHKACKWAENQHTLDEAATKITERINKPPLPSWIPPGTTLFEYDTASGGTNYASGGVLDCSEYLERLNGGTGKGKLVNCTDCACIVTTFANALGCKLFESQMGDDFLCNEIMSIGFNTWAVPFDQAPPPYKGVFSYHEVAWIGSCGNSDPLFDACLKVDGDSNPTSAPHSELLPTDLIFHLASGIRYKERLAATSGRPNCNPKPVTKKRRPVV